MSFQVGQKVVCVKRTPWTDLITHRPIKGPQLDSILTISELDDSMGDFYLAFEELQIHPLGRPYAPRYQAKFFRPIDYSFGEKVCEEITKICEQQTVEV